MKGNFKGHFLDHAYNLGQKVADEFTKLSKIGFFMECFAAGFLQFFTERHQNLAFEWLGGFLPPNPRISRISLRSKVLSRSATCEATRALNV